MPGSKPLNAQIHITRDELNIQIQHRDTRTNISSRGGDGSVGKVPDRQKEEKKKKSKDLIPNTMKKPQWLSLSNPVLGWSLADGCNSLAS